MRLLLEEVVVSVAELLVDGAADVSLLVVDEPVEPVPLAPMLDVPVPLAEPPAALGLVLLDVLGLVLLEVLGLVLELLGVLYVLLGELGLVLLDVLGLVVLLVVPPPPLLELPPDVCAMAKPPATRAAAAASVVRVFLVVIMSLLLEWKPRRGMRLKEAGDSADFRQPTFAGGRQKVGLCRQSL